MVEQINKQHNTIKLKFCSSGINKNNSLAANFTLDEYLEFIEDYDLKTLDDLIDFASKSLASKAKRSVLNILYFVSGTTYQDNSYEIIMTKKIFINIYEKLCSFTNIFKLL